MTFPIRKKLIEVVLPLDAINRGCEEDKNRKTGHIRNLHKWFAPMPLPAWRAMLFAALVDDPGEHLPASEAERERQRLLAIIGRLSPFEAYKDKEAIRAAREEIVRALGEERPVVVDPFCGGGSTLLEAQRLGLATCASDLNPVPVLIATVLCRAAPLFGGQRPVNPSFTEGRIGGWGPLAGLRTDVRYYASRIRDMAWERLKGFYPPIGEAKAYAYRWAWTVASPDPAAKGRHTPLVTDWWLSRHKNSRAWIDAVTVEDEVRFTIRTDGEPPRGTTGKTGGSCLLSNVPIPLEYIRTEGRAGRLSRAMLAIAARKNDSTLYLSPDRAQVEAATVVPETSCHGIDMPEAALGFRVQQYGIRNFLDLFTRRQAYSIETFATLVESMHREIVADAVRAGLPDDGVTLEGGGTGARAYADSVAAILGLCVGKLAQSNNILVRWFVDPRNGSGKATPAFDRHALPMVWDFVETNPFGGSVGDWMGPVLETALKALDLCVADGLPSEVSQRDARLVHVGLPKHSLIASDPPYYANIGYADLADFFYQWLRPALRSVLPNLFGTVATPKGEELIATPHRHGGSTERAKEYFRTGFAQVFGSLAEGADSRFPVLIVYAIKQSEESGDQVQSTGWEVFLGGLIDAGLVIVATWPVRTTTDTRMIGLGTNALASAIFVVGRRRSVDAPKVSRAQFVRELREALPDAIGQLKAANIAPVDLAQAAIGPGMAIYSRYAAVIETDGSTLSVRSALAAINFALDEVLVEQEGDFDPETRWALAWFELYGFTEGPYGAAETLCKAKNATINGMVEAGLAVAKGGKVRLFTLDDLNADWNPGTARRPTVWMSSMHLIRRLETIGESGAAVLLRNFSTDTAEAARDLAYRAYIICDRRKWAKEALAFNGLVIAWPEITRLAQQAPAGMPTQGELL